MAEIDDLKNQIQELEQRLSSLQKNLDRARKKEEEIQETRYLNDELKKYRAEATKVSHHLDAWIKGYKNPWTSSDRFSLLFLGGCSGEWAARTRYRGELPGFGGIFLNCNGKKLLLDPGAHTFDELLAQGIHPASLDAVIVTHSHWDCVRDLPLLVLAACPGSALSGHKSDVSPNNGNSTLHLYADRSVIFGLPRGDLDAFIDRLTSLDNSFGLPDPNYDRAELRDKLAEFYNMVPGVLNIHDLLVRLGGRYTPIEIGHSYSLDENLRFFTRHSFHKITYGGEFIPAIDLVMNDQDGKSVRCVYLSDTKYEPKISESYITPDLGPIDLLICNVKTLDVSPHSDRSKTNGFTKQHLGWKGLMYLARDFKRRKLLTSESLVVLRAWGIETVTELDDRDGVLVATPDKLGVYEQLFQREQKLRSMIPGITWVHMEEGEEKYRINHVKAPFHDKGAYMKFGNIFYCSDAMKEIIRGAWSVTDAPEVNVLITGETGTGKDELAKAIHTEAGGKRKGGLANINARQFNSDLFYSQLAGHTKGTFTGAVDNRSGYFETVRDGTIVIQEVHALSISVQTTLLTALTQREFTPQGAREPKLLRAQMIFTTDHDLQGEVTEGKFLQQLFFRMNRPLNIPPLRERPEDIPVIIEGWRREDILAMAKMPTLSSQMIDLLKQFEWPGNARQLANCLREVIDDRAFIDYNDAQRYEQLKKVVEKSHKNFIARSSEVAGNFSVDPAPVLSLKRVVVLDEMDRIILRELGDNAHPMKRSALEHTLGENKRSTIIYHLRKLKDGGLVTKLGQGMNTKYILTGQGKELL